MRVIIYVRRVNKKLISGKLYFEARGDTGQNIDARHQPVSGLSIGILLSGHLISNSPCQFRLPQYISSFPNTQLKFENYETFLLPNHQLLWICGLSQAIIALNNLTLIKIYIKT